jgi:chorismate mutase
MTTRGIRGAITIERDTKENVLAATGEMLEAILAANPNLQLEDIASAFFTATDDIVSAFPALAARNLGWDQIPMICGREIPVPDSLPFCIRVLIHWNTGIKQSDIHHVYLRDAKKLRPDLTAYAK